MKSLFLLILTIVVSFSFADTLTTTPVTIPQELLKELQGNKMVSHPESWKINYSCQEGKNVLQLANHTINLLTVEQMQSLQQQCSIPASLVSCYEQYLASPQQVGFVYPNAATKVDATLPQNWVTTTDVITAALKAYNIENTCFSLGCSDNNWSVNNPECLTFLQQQSRVLVFFWMAGNWNPSTLAGTVDVELDYNRNILPAVGGYAMELVGFDTNKKLFVFDSLLGTSFGQHGYVYLSHDYIKTYAQYALFTEPQQEMQISTQSVETLGSVAITISKWDVGGGNFLHPSAKAWGEIIGSKEDVCYIRMVVEYDNGRLVVLQEQNVQPGTFYIKDEYSRFNTRYIIIEILDSRRRVRAYAQHRI